MVSPLVVSGPVDPAAHDEARAGFCGVVVVTSDAGDGGLGADGLDQAAQGPFLGGCEVPLEGIGRG